MKQYFKDGLYVEKPKAITINGRYVINPNDKLLEEAGYEIKESEIVPDNNDIIKVKRQTAYKERADQYLIAYQAYKELGDTAKALEMKELWLKEREAIDKEFSYI
jgi:hypothetical protein